MIIWNELRKIFLSAKCNAWFGTGNAAKVIIEASAAAQQTLIANATDGFGPHGWLLAAWQKKFYGPGGKSNTGGASRRKKNIRPGK